jgi:hypothetical protein
MHRRMQAESRVTEHENEQQGLQTLARGEIHWRRVLTKVRILTMPAGVSSADGET